VRHHAAAGLCYASRTDPGHLRPPHALHGPVDDECRAPGRHSSSTGLLQRFFENLHHDLENILVVIDNQNGFERPFGRATSHDPFQGILGSIGVLQVQRCPAIRPASACKHFNKPPVRLLLGFPRNRMEQRGLGGKPRRESFGLVGLTACGQVTKYSPERLNDSGGRVPALWLR